MPEAKQSVDVHTKYADVRSRLNEIFRHLWGDPNGVVGGFFGSAYRDHQNFIRRGQLLLAGTCHGWRGFWVLAEGTVLGPAPNAPAAINISAMPPVLQGELINVAQEDGPWWDKLLEELPLMEQELREHKEQVAAAAQAKWDAAQAAQAGKLCRASEALV